MAVFTKPVMPGSAIDIVGEATTNLPSNEADIVALTFTADWGPIAAPVRAQSLSKAEEEYGSSPSPARTAIIGAFNGVGLPGQGGAGAIVGVRMATPTAAAAFIVVNSPPVGAGAATPALRLEGFYKGTRGNLIGYTVGADPSAPTTTSILRIFFRGARVDEYTYPSGDIAALAANINLVSRLVKATSLATGSPLTAVASPASLTGGNDGAAVTGTEYSEALAALEFERFTILAPHDLTDSAILATVVAYVRSQEKAYRPIILVTGGPGVETTSAAIARAASIADPHVVAFAKGIYRDDLLELDLSTAQLAPRFAGILASRGRSSSLTFSEVAGLRLISNGASSDELPILRNAGLSTLRRVSTPRTQLVIAQGVTTFINKVTAARPYDVFSDPRLIRVMDLFIRAMKEWGDEHIVGDVTVTDDSRASVRGHANKLIDELLILGLVLPGGTPFGPGLAPEPFVRTPIPSDINLADAIPFEFGWVFARTANFVIGNGTVR